MFLGHAKIENSHVKSAKNIGYIVCSWL